MTFFIYTGANSTDEEKCRAESVALQFAKHIPKHKSSQYFLTTGFLHWIWWSNYKIWAFWHIPLLEQTVKVTVHWTQKKMWKRQEEVSMFFEFFIKTVIITVKNSHSPC